MLLPVFWVSVEAFCRHVMHERHTAYDEGYFNYGLILFQCFNYDKYYSWAIRFNSHARYIDVKGGLSLVLAPQLDNTKTSLYSEGIKLLVHEPNVFPSDLTFEKVISHKTETLVRLTTVATSCTKDVEALPVHDRGCLYDDEKRLRYNEWKYNKQNYFPM